jgi:hypothetical protein
VNDLYNKATEATKNLVEVVSGLMSQPLDVLIIINAAGTVGTASIETAIGYGVAAYYTYQAYKLYEEISNGRPRRRPQTAQISSPVSR